MQEVPPGAIMRFILRRLHAPQAKVGALKTQFFLCDRFVLSGPHDYAQRCHFTPCFVTVTYVAIAVAKSRSRSELLALPGAVRNAEVGSSNLLPSTSIFLTRISRSAHVLAIADRAEGLHRVDLSCLRGMRVPLSIRIRPMANPGHSSTEACHGPIFPLHSTGDSSASQNSQRERQHRKLQHEDGRVDAFHIADAEV